MTTDEITRIANLFTAAGRRNVPVPIEEWKQLMATRIGKATIKDGKIKPVRKQSASQRAAGLLDRIQTDEQFETFMASIRKLWEAKKKALAWLSENRSGDRPN